LYHGVGLAVCTNYRQALGRPGEALGRWLARHAIVGWAVTLLFVHVGWLLFFYPIPSALSMVHLLLGGH
jgi:hypothetical protein